MPGLAQQLQEGGVDAARAASLASAAAEGGLAAWRRLREALLPDDPWPVHLRLFQQCFPDGMAGPVVPKVWEPSAADLEHSQLGKLLQARGCDYEALHRWSAAEPEEFWQGQLRALQVPFRQPWSEFCDLRLPEAPRWLVGARLNIAEACFLPSEAPAIIHAGEDGALHRVSRQELWSLSGRVARGLREAGFPQGAAIAIDMPMGWQSVAIYLGIVRSGCAAISIADSFAAEEIATRLRIGQAAGIFTQDVIVRGAQRIPLYPRVCEAAAPRAVVLAAGSAVEGPLRAGDLSWDAFLPDDASFDTVACDPDTVSNILFSSGTTGEPKAIPWTHTTPLKCAVDGRLHHDIRPGDVVAWPTSLGWMMGPWLIYASLVNRASIALFESAPNSRAFARFVQDAGVTMLGVVPSLVAAWKAQDSTAGLDWTSIRCFSSTGECSNAEDMLWLMARARYRPVIEYCGGTEIGGGYITGSLVQPAAPATFSTPALGLDFVLLDEQGASAEEGEVFITGPSIGLSSRLLNRDHREVYFEGCPQGSGSHPLRRHGDCMQRLPGGYYRAHGRVDDTMNLGGIKVSSAEIERAVDGQPGVRETAAIAVAPAGGGPSQLVIYAVPQAGAELEADGLRQAMQQAIRAHLNPLFKLRHVVLRDSLPRTASNKVMRRVLRQEYGS